MNQLKIKQKSTHLINDTFVVKDGMYYLIYSPYKGIISRVQEFPQKNSKIFKELFLRGFFSKIPESTKCDTLKKWKGFFSLTLLLTRKCNLKCTYCIVRAGLNGPSMSQNLAIASLNWFVNQLSRDVIRISFHSGGEPTLEKDLIKKVVFHAKQIKGDRRLNFQIVTNGTSDNKFMDWLINKNFGISISMDGPPSIQDRNRPFFSGNKSSFVVEKNVRNLVNKNYPFTIRLTFSPIDDIEKIITYFGELGVRSLHLEPLFPYGREYDSVLFGKTNSSNKIYAPEGEELLSSFIKALDIAKKYNIRIINGHLSHFTKGVGYFCGAASGRSIIVTHDGFLSGCLEVVDSKDKDFNIFQLGKFINEKNIFEIDNSKLFTMHSRHADLLPNCKTCYARYTCAGGCSVKAVRASNNFFDRDLPYCHFTKKLIPILVKKIAVASNI